jgi:hypothetical protein
MPGLRRVGFGHPRDVAAFIHNERGESYDPPEEGVNIGVGHKDTSRRNMDPSETITYLGKTVPDIASDPELAAAVEEDDRELELLKQEAAAIPLPSQAHPATLPISDVISLAEGKMILEGRYVELTPDEMGQLNEIAVAALERSLAEEAKRIRESRLGTTKKVSSRKLSKSGK